MNAIVFARKSSAGPAAPWRAESRALFQLALPLVLTQMAQMAMGTTDTVMMGWLGADALAAGSLANHFYGFFVLIGMGVMAAVAPMVAQALGARQFRHVRRSVRQGLWAAVAVGLPGGVAVWHAEAILTALGQDPAVAAAGQAYLRATVWGFVPALWYMVLSHFLAAHSKPRPALVVTLIAIAVNVLGNYALMFGHFGLPRLELVGAGVSTAIVDGFLFLALLGYIAWDRRFRRYRILARIWRPDWPRFVEIFRVGLPIGLSLLAEIGLFLASSLLIGLIDSDQLAAHGLAIQCIALVYMVPYGIGEAATVRVGLAVGADRVADIGLAGWTALAWGAGFAVLPALAFWFVGREIVTLYLDPAVPGNAAAVGFAVGFLEVAALFQLADAAQVVTMGALRGLKDTRVPMVLAVAGYWGLGFSAAVFCAFELGYEGLGAWIGLAVGLTATAPLMIWRFRARLRRLTARPCLPKGRASGHEHRAPAV